MTTPTSLHPKYTPFDIEAWKRENEAPALKAAPTQQWAVESDLLTGVEAIAAHLNMTKRQAYHLHETEEIPTFKLGAKVCALRSALAEHFAEQTRLAMQNRKAR